MQLAEGLPLIQGDRVQLQQVVLNLVLNAVEAMSSVDDAPRELSVGAERWEADEILRQRCVIRDQEWVRNILSACWNFLLHDQAKRNWARPLDLPLHRRGARRTAMGRSK